MDENTERKKSSSTNAITIGVKSQETADRFVSVANRIGQTYERTLVYLLDTEEKPNPDNSEAIAKLQQRIGELEGKLEEANRFISKNGEIVEGKDLEIADLQEKLEAAVKEANENAESGLGKQLKLEEFQQLTDGAIIIKPNPVVAYFLNEMAAKTGSTPARILEELYLADLQNPTVNNLPYTVSSGEIRQVIRKLKEEAVK